MPAYCSGREYPTTLPVLQNFLPTVMGITKSLLTCHVDRTWVRWAAIILLMLGFAAGGGLLYRSTNAQVVAAFAQLDETAQALTAAQEAHKMAEAAKAELESRVQALEAQVAELRRTLGVVQWSDVPVLGVTTELQESYWKGSPPYDPFRPRVAMLLSECLRLARPTEATEEDQAWLARAFRFWPSALPLPVDHYLTVEFDQPVRFTVGGGSVVAEVVTPVVRGQKVRLLFSNGAPKRQARVFAYAWPRIDGVSFCDYSSHGGAPEWLASPPLQSSRPA